MISGEQDLPTESSDSGPPSLSVPIVHVHIPKTAGTALSVAFREAYGSRLRVYPIRYESEYGQVEYSGFNFFGGHIGFKVAGEIDGDLITVLRDPTDRFISNYFFLRQQYIAGEARNHKTHLAARYDLDQFVQIWDEPVLQKELLNRMTWQIAYSHRLELRRDLVEAGIGDQQLVQLAISNLMKFTVVGIQTDIAGLAEAIRRRYNVRLSIGRINVSDTRLAKADIALRTLKNIERWVELDNEFYRTWIGMQPNGVSLAREAIG
jgi:hypothetical protein